MEFTSLIFPTKNVCRTCLMDSETFMNMQDLIEHEMNQVKLVDILIFLNCLENNDEENWPQGLCSTCVSTALLAYNFKLSCLKANTTISQILTIQSSPLNLQRSDIDAIDINVVYQDHEYDVPLFSNHPALEFGANEAENKELTPLPPVTEITCAEQPLKKEGEKKFACTVCNKSFTRIYSLRYHMEKHTGDFKHLCCKCGKCFPTSGGLRQHLARHKEPAQFKCGFCKKVYKSRQYLKEHFRVAHSNNRKNFVCVTCGKTFTAKSTLLMHNNIHSGEKPYACTFCPKRYTRALYLKIHSLVHEGKERPKNFKCSFKNCGRSFFTKHSLTVHVAHTHSTERLHQCDICLKRFPTASGLKVHRTSHENTDFTCNICGQQLSSKKVMQKHKKTHDVDSNDMVLETVVDNVFFDGLYYDI